MQKQKPNYRPLFFTVLLAIVAAASVIYLTVGESQKTLPKIKVSYFKDNNEFANAIEQRLSQEIGQNKYFWLGYEPEKANQFDLTVLVKNAIEQKNGSFDIIILDRELHLAEDKAQALGSVQQILLKEHFSNVAELIKANKDKKILIVTAAIYSTNFIKENPHGKIFEITQLKPMTFSMGYFPSVMEEEKNNLFKCDTEDKTGTSPWGCAVLNKARAVRRKIDLAKLNEAPGVLLGLMDLTGEKDYMILVGK